MLIVELFLDSFIWNLSSNADESKSDLFNPSAKASMILVINNVREYSPVKATNLSIATSESSFILKEIIRFRGLNGISIIVPLTKTLLEFIDIGITHVEIGS